MLALMLLYGSQSCIYQKGDKINQRGCNKSVLNILILALVDRVRYSIVTLGWFGRLRLEDSIDVKMGKDMLGCFGRVEKMAVERLMKHIYDENMGPPIFPL